MTKYKLFYFPVRAMAEKIRYIFAFAEVPFEDIQLERNIFNTEYKPKFPFGQVPVLEIDGKQILAQSNAISRFLAKEFNLIGSNNFEAAQADMFVDGLMDLLPSYRPLRMAKVNSGEKEMKEEWAKFQETLIPFLDRYENFLANNGTGFLVGSKVTWADLTVAEFLERMESCFDRHALDSHPKLKQFVEKIHQNPGIAKYVSGRRPMPC